MLMNFKIECSHRRWLLAGAGGTLVLVLVLSSCASGSGRTVPLDHIIESLESTMLRSWMACKPGDFVEFTVRRGNDVIQCKHTYEGRNQDGTIRLRTERSGSAVMEASLFEGDEKVTNFREGTETITIGNIRVICNVLQGEGTKGSFKLWISPEIPGALVRMESPRGSLEVTNFKKSATIEKGAE